MPYLYALKQTAEDKSTIWMKAKAALVELERKKWQFCYHVTWQPQATQT